MKVEILTSTVAAKKNVKKGDIVELTDAEAHSLINMGKAKEAGAKGMDTKPLDTKGLEAKKVELKKADQKKTDQPVVTGPTHFGDKDSHGKN